jgi:hypothetical protein
MTITQGDRKTVYNQRGERLFSTSAEKIQHIGCGLFVIQQNEKKGLVSHRGKQVLPVEYEAIGTPNKGLVSLLKSAKFGLYDCEKNRLIKPAYDKNILPYNDSHVIAYKNGSYGFLNWNSRASDRFEFNEVLYWNDTSALVRKNSQWMIYNFKSKEILMDKIKGFKLVHDTPLQKIAIIRREESYGVLHNKNGVTLPLSYSYIVNVGSADEPMYFTEQYMKEPLIFIVIYYDNEGKMVRKEIYDQNDYDNIYCDRN